jgi:hypothetical protein
MAPPAITFIVLNLVIGVLVNAFRGVMQGADAPPGVPPVADHRPPMNLEQEIQRLHRKLDRLPEQG